MNLSILLFANFGFFLDVLIIHGSPPQSIRNSHASKCDSKNTKNQKYYLLIFDGFLIWGYISWFKPLKSIIFFDVRLESWQVPILFILIWQIIILLRLFFLFWHFWISLIWRMFQQGFVELLFINVFRVALTLLNDLTQRILNFNLNVFLTYSSFSTIFGKRGSQSIEILQVRVIIAELFVGWFTWCLKISFLWILYSFGRWILCLIGSEHLFIKVWKPIIWVTSINMFKFWNVDGFILSTIQMTALLRINNWSLVLILIKTRIHNVDERFAFHIENL